MEKSICFSGSGDGDYKLGVHECNYEAIVHSTKTFNQGNFHEETYNATMYYSINSNEAIESCEESLMKIDETIEDSEWRILNNDNTHHTENFSQPMVNYLTETIIDDSHQVRRRASIQDSEMKILDGKYWMKDEELENKPSLHSSVVMQVFAGDCIGVQNDSDTSHDISGCDSVRTVDNELEVKKRRSCRLALSKSDHQKNEENEENEKKEKKEIKPKVMTKNVYKEVKQLQNECDEIIPRLTALEHEMKQSEERTLYQIRTLKMNFKKYDQESALAHEVNEAMKKKVAELDYRVIYLDLQLKLSENIHKSTQKNLNKELANVRCRLLELGRTMNGLWENTKKLADFMMPKENTDGKSLASLRWIFRPISAVRNSLSSRRKSTANGPADISSELTIQS